MFHRLIVASLQTVIPFLLIAALLQNTINGETMHMDVNPSIKAMLLEELADSYPKPRTTRPVANTNTTTMIKSMFVLTQVIQLDDVKQILELSGWVTMEWQDEFVSWNLTETGVECLQVPKDTVWIPDIVLLQNIDKDHTYFMQSVPVNVCYNGSVRLSSVAIFKTFCHIDIKHYPKDRQTCVLEFISWTYDVSKLVFIPIPTDVDQKNEFVENEIWKLPANGVQGNGTVHRYSSSTYASLQYSITLQRRNEFQTRFYFAPYYICSFLMPFMFVIPHDSGERLTYGITVLLGQIVFHQLIVLSLPPVGDNVPKIGNYFLAVITISLLCLLIAVILGRLFSKKKENETGTIHQHLKLLLSQQLQSQLQLQEQQLSQNLQELKNMPEENREEIEKQENDLKELTKTKTENQSEILKLQKDLPVKQEENMHWKFCKHDIPYTKTGIIVDTVMAVSLSIIIFIILLIIIFT